MYSIPDAHISEFLVDSESACRLKTSKEKLNKEGKLMDNKKLKRVRKWAIKYSFSIVLILSVIHLSIAYIHTRESGRTDLFLF